MSWLEALRSVSHNTMGWLAASNESEIAFDRCAFRCIMHVTCYVFTVPRVRPSDS